MKVEALVGKLLDSNFSHFTGVPCSIVKPLVNKVIDSEKCSFIPATVEGEAISIAAGAYLAGVNYVVFLQNSGLGNIINPLTSLTELYKTPVLLFVCLRGEPGINDAVQHEMMGVKTIPLLETLDVDYGFLDSDESKLDDLIKRAEHSIRTQRKTFCIVLKKGTLDSYELEKRQNYKRGVSFEKVTLGVKSPELPSRQDACIEFAKISKDRPVISSTGFTSREFFNADDRALNFYMQGSMGFASSIALGLSFHHKEKVYCLDGDGSILMRLSNLATLGMFHKGNLVYALLDNGVHDSTGGQSTISSNVDFCKLAESVGFERFIEINDVKQIEAAGRLTADSDALTFIYIRTRPGKGTKMDRPKFSLQEITDRFMGALKCQM
jgi:phosphonopyruvate decarboxylase